MKYPNLSAGGLCPAGSAIFMSGDAGPLWRVAAGVVRLERKHGPQRQVVRLALPGDLIGIESLCGKPYQFDANALTPLRIEPVACTAPEERDCLMQQALLQQLARYEDMATLRTGPVAQRLAHLLRLLGLAWQAWSRPVVGAKSQAGGGRKMLPSLREMAQVVDAQHETVCRALARLERSGTERETQSFNTADASPAKVCPT
jgi:CRP-like cAMP-binding protein